MENSFGTGFSGVTGVAPELAKIRVSDTPPGFRRGLSGSPLKQKHGILFSAE